MWSQFEAFALSCILLCCAWLLSLEACSFPKRNGGGVDLGERAGGWLGEELE